jgi:hypothetical protein
MGMSAAVAIAGTVISSAVSSDASRKAANTQADAARNAAQTQKDIAFQQMELQKPWIEAGKATLPMLAAGVAPGGEFNKPYTMADFVSGPQKGLYDFAKAESLEAMTNQAAKGGQDLSTNAIVGAGKLSSDLAARYFNTGATQDLAQRQLALGATESLAGTGQSATNVANTNLGNLGTSVGNMQLTTGNAMAAGTIGQANAVNKGVSGVSSDISTMYTLQQLFGGSSGIGGSSGTTTSTTQDLGSGVTSAGG